MATFSNSPFSIMQFATRAKSQQREFEPTTINCAWKMTDFPMKPPRFLFSKTSSFFEIFTKPFFNIGYRFLTAVGQDIIQLGRPRTRHSKRIREIASHTHLITYEPVLFLLLRFILYLYVELCTSTYIYYNFYMCPFFLSSGWRRKPERVARVDVA